MLTLEPLSEDQGRSAVHPSRGSPQSVSFRLTGLLARRLAHMSDSLVRVSRRVEWGAHRPASGARRCRGTPEARAACHDRGDGVPRAYRRPGLWPPPQSTLVHAPSRSADRLVAVPHPTGAHRRPPSASLPTISSTL